MKEVDWKPEHYVSLEKNAKARQLILNGLVREDMDKVIGIPTAKGIWKALKEIHEGVRNNTKVENLPYKENNIDSPWRKPRPAQNITLGSQGFSLSFS